MVTITGTRAAAEFPVYQTLGVGQLAAAYGSYALAANPSAADILQLCRLPAGAVVLGGWLRAQDIDTGTAALDIDVGWAANGAEAADPDGFGNFGVLSGAAVANYLPEGGILLPLHGVLASGPVSFSRETVVQCVFNAPANAGGTGVVTVVVLYTVPA
jgi:hypothetical protein